MFSVGITTTIADFKECLKRPGAIVPWCFCVVGREVGTAGIQKIHQYPTIAGHFVSDVLLKASFLGGLLDL